MHLSYLFVVIAIASCLSAVKCICNRLTLQKVTVRAYFTPTTKVSIYKGYDLQEFSNFYKLDVSGGNVSVLCSMQIIDLPGVQHLLLVNMNISDIEIDGIYNLPDLGTLSLTTNKLTRVKVGQFNNIISLKNIYLSDNLIEYVEDAAFDSMPLLKRVYLDRNRINGVNGNLFLSCPQIRVVEMSFNRITNVPEDAFKNLNPEHLTPVQFHLRHNQISDISEKAIQREHQIVLRLEHNNITELNDEILNNLGHLEEVSLYKNPLKCKFLKKLDRLSMQKKQQKEHFPFKYDGSSCQIYTGGDETLQEIYTKDGNVYFKIVNGPDFSNVSDFMQDIR